MSQHSVFYYPYASLTTQQSPILKAAALYFDKLYLLDPTKASWNTIGAGEMYADLQLLEQEGILERIVPEEVLHQHEQAIVQAISMDREDAEFLKLCEEQSTRKWKLALAKVPQPLRDDPKYQPLEAAMKRVMAGYGEIYDESQGSLGYSVEYRWVDFPFAIGEAIMLNHALVGSLLHTAAIPITDEPIHNKILDYKLQKAQQIPAIRAVLENRVKEAQFAQTQLATQALTDLPLGVIPPTMSLEKILEYRNRYAGELETVREEFHWLARTITEQPWTKAFADEVYHKTIPDLREKLKPAQNSWSSWLKMAGIALGGAAVVLELFANPLTSIAVAVAGLTIAKDVGIESLQAFQEWKEGKKQNGLHYLIKLKQPALLD